jgi:putative membrane protein
MGYPMHGWGVWGPGWAAFGVLHLLVWIVIVIGTAWLVRWIWTRDGRPPAAGGDDRALAILRERYARGEIDDAEFEARKAALGR